MMTKIEDIWRAIRDEAITSPSNDNGWKLVRLDPDHPFDIYAAIDGSGLAMLAFGLSALPPSIDGDTDALDYVRFQRSAGRWLMGLRLAGQGLESVFGRLCQDLVDAAAEIPSETALVALFRERLMLWKRLFRDGGNGLLQKFQIKGLIGELIALEEFIRLHPDKPLLSVLAWTGPGGTSQDFMFSNYAVEVKAVSANALTVSISSAEQLDCLLPLVLRTYVLREAPTEEAGALTLPLLAARIEQLLAVVPGGAAMFREKLLESGYVEHEYYRSVAYSTLEMRLYTVGPAFPRITPVSLPVGIPDVSYSILFSSLEQFRILETQDAA
ncbi:MULTISPECIES: PD-(D/E)XK motif protein [unclassified Janthinobacterium]|uniref:PD-(D/E)XK motif protein n=1 Tax=unclassified Janthinobacterium TaxID=2610881 RepID=UPI00160E2B6F|nr:MULTISPECIES: PD-(D/E)XK motif protein [unclassified Janthinobacterium]MBB5371637.1 hypothetical protein [Janthinobacterium sp. K2C7]MBB5384442.1 hypothetical protein [Janthinobacterium sp. K2Li3]MBB5389718.1 hypothetical protein [Janthinobacterium sp. K2E3]